MNKKQKIKTHILAFLSALGIGYFFFMFMDRDIPVKILEHKVLSLRPDGKFIPGSHIIYQWTAITKKDCYGYVDRVLVDSNNVKHMYETTNTVVRQKGDLGSVQIYSRILKLPENIAKGKVIHKAQVRYICNFTQNTTWTWPFGPIKYEYTGASFNVE